MYELIGLYEVAQDSGPQKVSRYSRYGEWKITRSRISINGKGAQ